MIDGWKSDLGEIYEKIFQEGRLRNEIKRFTDSDNCEIIYRRSTILDK